MAAETIMGILEPVVMADHSKLRSNGGSESTEQLFNLYGRVGKGQQNLYVSAMILRINRNDSSGVLIYVAHYTSRALALLPVYGIVLFDVRS